MPLMNRDNTFSIATLLALAICLPARSLDVSSLRCEHRTNPEGLDIREPRLSWTLTGTKRGECQTAYHLLVASSPSLLEDNKGDLWDSGKVRSDQTVHIVYAGKPLASRARVWWKVRVWDRDSRASRWSKPGTWSMGLLEAGDWRAKWIHDPAAASTSRPRGPLNGYHSEFSASPNAHKWIAIDLGQPRAIDAVRLFPARPYDWNPDTPGFLFPLRYRVEASDDPEFENTRVLVDRSETDEPNPGTEAVVWRFPPLMARHIRLMVVGLRQRDADNHAFALAEIDVLSGNTNVARGCKVASSDSIETGAWAAVNLTDGVSSTVPPATDGTALPATMLRKAFTLSGPARRATLFATAEGLYELRINGRRVGTQLLAPEWTNYRRRCQYQIYDVTGMLKTGDNAVAALLGEGWYAGRLMVVGKFSYGSCPRLLIQLEIERTDGARELIVSDETWRSTRDGPITASGIYDGEHYDARKEFPGWDRAGFDDRAWSNVVASPLDERALAWQANEPIEVEQELSSVGLSEPRPGIYVFDLGQNVVGWCRVKAHGMTGQTVAIRHAEMLNDDGTVYTANLRGAAQTDRYTPRADGVFEFEPHFTYHGFRYVELSGVASPPGPAAVRARVFHSAAPLAGRFQCSNPSLNRLMENILWTQRANLMSSPNDCPQRDERFGWMGDIQVFAQTAIFNMDMSAFFTKWLQDVRDDQADDGRFPDFAPHPGNPNTQFSAAPAWADAGTIVPWRVWQNYADTRLLDLHFESARRWVDFVHSKNPELIWREGRGNDYNDWLNGDWIRQTAWPTNGGSVPKPVFATAFFAHSAELVARMARITGRSNEATHYAALAGRIKSAFNRAFVNDDGVIEGDTQGGYALALNFDLLPDQLRPKAARHLVNNIRRYDNHLSTGIQTTHRAMLELVRAGYDELAWQLLTNRTFPSWLYMLDNGATTIWERWDGYVRGRGFQDAGMNSFNHWAFGAVGEWVWRNVVGLNPDDSAPGWKHFIVAPRPGGGAEWAHGDYDSIRGTISVQWSVTNREFHLRVVVPPNTSADIRLPVEGADLVLEGGKPWRAAQGVSLLVGMPEEVVFRVESGIYDFRAPVGRSRFPAIRNAPQQP